jgi:hypothetical protein
MGDMKSQKPMSEEEVDKNLVDSFPASDPPSWTVGTDHKAPTEEKRSDLPMRGVFHQLARFFNGLHWAAGMTTLPDTATPKEERAFVLMWLGIVVFVIVFFAGFIYLLTW